MLCKTCFYYLACCYEAVKIPLATVPFFFYIRRFRHLSHTHTLIPPTFIAHGLIIQISWAIEIRKTVYKLANQFNFLNFIAHLLHVGQLLLIKNDLQIYDNSFRFKSNDKKAY